MDSVFGITSKNLLLLFSLSVMFNSLWSHRPRHTRLSCPLPSPQGGQQQWSGWGALYSTRLLGGRPSQGGQQQQRGQGALLSWVSSNIALFQPTTTAGSLPRPLVGTLTRVYILKRTASETTRVLGMSSGYVEQLKGMSLLVRAWENMVHWRRQWKTSILALRTPWTVWKEFVA